ncbi:MAG: biotin/lipoyl-binding protein, partial [Chloroflexota bacterium]
MARISVSALPRGWRAAPPRLIAGALVTVTAIGILSALGILGRVEGLVPGLSPAAPLFQTTPARRGDLAASVVATGPVSTTNDLPLTFKESGKLATVKVNVGDPVSRGEVLATLN